MTIVAVSMVRDEQDVIEHTVRAMAEHVDHLIVADNLSTDDTGPILHQLARELPLTVVADRQLAYLQSRKLSAIARQAAVRHRARPLWIVPFDADEVFVTERPMRDVLDDIDADEVRLRWMNHHPTALDPPSPNPLHRMGWRDPHPQTLAKIIARWKPGLTIAQGNHSCWYPSRHKTADCEEIVVHHFPIRSPEQHLRKILNGIAAYRAAGSQLPPGAGVHWKQLAPRFERGGIDAARAEFTAATVTDPAGRGLVYDPVVA